MKTKLKPVTYGLIFLIFIFVLIFSVLVSSFNKRIYKSVYRSDENIKEFSGFTEEEYLGEIKRLKGYLFNTREDSSLIDSVYSEDEVSHMKDVYRLFRMVRIICGLSFFAAWFIIIKNKKCISSIDISRRWHLFIVYPVLIFAPAIINFEKFWTTFHKVLFSNDLWLMDPRYSLMINLLPEKIFYSISMMTIIVYFIIVLVAVLCFRFFSKREEKASYGTK